MLVTRSERRNIAATAQAKRPNPKAARLDNFIKLLVDRHTEFTVMLANALADRRYATVWTREGKKVITTPRPVGGQKRLKLRAKMS